MLTRFGAFLSIITNIWKTHFSGKMNFHSWRSRKDKCKKKTPKCYCHTFSNRFHSNPFYLLFTSDRRLSNGSNNDNNTSRTTIKLKYVFTMCIVLCLPVFFVKTRAKTLIDGIMLDDSDVKWQIIWNCVWYCHKWKVVCISFKFETTWIHIYICSKRMMNMR